MYYSNTGSIYNASSLTLLVGSIHLVPEDSGAINVSIDVIVVNSNFSRTTKSSDIALLHFAVPVNFSSVVIPICLPSPQQDMGVFKTCMDTGFGYTQPNG